MLVVFFSMHESARARVAKNRSRETDMHPQPHPPRGYAARAFGASTPARDRVLQSSRRPLTSRSMLHRVFFDITLGGEWLMPSSKSMSGVLFVMSSVRVHASVASVVPLNAMSEAEQACSRQPLRSRSTHARRLASSLRKLTAREAAAEGGTVVTSADCYRLCKASEHTRLESHDHRQTRTS